MSTLSNSNNSNYDEVMGEIEFTHVDGENKGDIRLFALSTCQWCAKTRKFLEDNNVAYDYVYVDLSTGEQREYIMTEFEKYNPDLSFPTIVINGNKVIVGYNPEEMEKEFDI